MSRTDLITDKTQKKAEIIKLDLICRSKKLNDWLKNVRFVNDLMDRFTKLSSLNLRHD